MLKQTSTFTMAVGSLSGGGQDWHTKDISDYKFTTGGTLWVGLYRNPSGGHIFGRPSSPGASAYQKTNTSSFPSVSSMSGYSTDSGDEVSVGLFYIEAPAAVSSVSVSRVSDNQQNLTWSNNNTTDEPYDNVMVYRYDNVTGSYILKATLSGSTESYNDTTTIANRRYRYYVKAYNTSGYSSATYSDYIRTTPAAPSSVVAARSGNNVVITWNDNSGIETNQTIQRNTSTDGVTWAGYADLDTGISSNTETYTDTSPANYNYYKVRADCTDPTLHSAYTESNLIIVIQPPDQPSGLLPTDSSAIDGDDANTFSWTHNPLDSTPQSKFSLKVKVQSGIYPKEIEKFDDNTDWTASGATLADDTTNIVTGLGTSVSMADSDDTGSTISMYQTISTIDLTEFDDASASDTADLISLLVYVSDVSYFTDLTLKLGDDNTDNYSTNVDPSASWSNGWNTLTVAKSAFSTNGTPAGWDDITYVRLDATTANNASSENLSFQYLQLAKVTNYTSYAGNMFVQYHEITSLTESLSLIAESFQNGYTFEWQVKTWGQHATAGDWSDTATFVASTTPVATITDPSAVSNYVYSSLELDWDYTQPDSSNQTEYVAYLYNSDDTLLETLIAQSEKADGESDTATFTTALENNSTYTAKLKVKSAAGLWSELAEVEFDTVFLAPTTPTITVTENAEIGGVNIAIVNPDVVVNYENNSEQDTYINLTNSTTNYNDNGQLDLLDDTAGGTDVSIILLDFDLSEFDGDTIVSANLYLYRETALTPGIDSAVNYIKTAWDETTVTYGSIPTLDTTDYDDHTHSAGETEIWDVATLVQGVADGSITDYEGMAIVATTTDGSADYFYDSTVTDSEPELVVEISPRNAETSYNKIYRSVAGGDWELVDTDISKNTTIIDYIPNIGGNTNYYCEAVSTLPSSTLSTEIDIDINQTGYFYINGGSSYEDYSKLYGDIIINENRGRETALKKYYGRSYPVKFEGENLNHGLKFECELPKTEYSNLFSIIETAGNHFFRDWNGRYFEVAIINPRVISKTNNSYQFSCQLERVG